MVGAACLLLVVVLVVPSILDGNRRPEVAPAGPGETADLDLRTHTISLDGAQRSPPVPQARPAGPGTDAAVASAPPETSPPVPVDTAAKEPADTVVEPPAVAPPAGEAQAVAPPPRTQAPKTVVPKVEGPGATVPPPARPGPGAVAGGEWYVQLGSFSRRDNAERLVADATRRGFPAGMIEGQGSRGPMFRVRVGPAGSREAAAELARKLAAAGFSGQVTRK